MYYRLAKASVLVCEWAVKLIFVYTPFAAAANVLLLLLLKFIEVMSLSIKIVYIINRKAAIRRMLQMGSVCLSGPI